MKWWFSEASKMHTSNCFCENEQDMLQKYAAIEIHTKTYTRTPPLAEARPFV